LVGGALTIATGGIAAIPVLIAGTSIGLAAGVTGGSAAISEKIVKSRQMKAAKTALEADEKATHDVQEKLQDLAQNKNFVKKITADFIKTGGSITSSSIKLGNLLMSSGSGLLTKGLETTAQLFGDDIGREVSKLIVAASGRVVSGSVTIVLGGFTMAYDIYKLSSQIETLATKSTESSAEELRQIAQKLEEAVEAIASTDEKTNIDDFKDGSDTNEI